MKQYLIRTVCTLLLAGLLFASPAFAAHGVVLNFNDVDISTMVKFISDLTGKNFVMDDRVKGKISVYSPTKLSIDEAYNVFTSVLELKGFTVIQSGKVLKVIPSANAKSLGFTLLPSGKRPPVNDSYIAQVIKLENISAQEALTFLQPLISRDGNISAFGSSNLLVLDAATNLRKVQDLLHIIDTERTREGVEIIYLKNAGADNAAKAIQQFLASGEGKAGQPTAAPGGTTGSVLADQRLNALIVFGNEGVKKAVREFVAKLDVPSPEAGNKVNVYYLENTDATEMAKVLDGVIKGMSSTAATSTPGQPTASTSSQSSSLTSAFGNDKITITADKGSNALVIMASAADYTNLLQVIKKLDRRSKQVFVKVTIAEVSLTKSKQLGTQLGAMGAADIGRYFGFAGIYDPFGVANTVSSSLSSLTTSTVTTPASIGAVLQALESAGLANVLSTPNILTSDNKEAEIVVGQNVPFQGSSTVSSGVTTTSVERKDVGITLKIKPQISEGDYIRMDMSQEISSVGATVTVGSGSTDRITTKRSAKTNVVVKDNQTVVIGGLIQDQDDETISKIPFLGDIPGLGWLFKTKTKSKTKTNLMILLTPHIVKDNEDLTKLSNEERGLFSNASKKVEPVDVQKEIGAK